MSEGEAAMDQTQQRAAEWAALAAAAFDAVTTWRQQHPTATLREIETAIDEHLAQVRARMLQDAALLSAAADLREVPAAARPVCPDCGQRLEARGKETRRLTTRHEQVVTRRRTRAVCPACGTALFPPG